MTNRNASIPTLLRDLAPQVVGVLARRSGQFDTSEDAVQEALLEADRQWRSHGIPDNPRGWLITVANRRLQDIWRQEAARRSREETAAPIEWFEPDLDPDAPGTSDDTLTLFMLCCHPSLSATSQIALTLRAVGGLSTAEIAAAYLTPEATMAQRISRAKATIRKTGASFDIPPPDEIPARLQTVMHVLYLMFNEGYVTSSGSDPLRPDLTTEAIRLTRMVRQIQPVDGEVAGLLALMLLTDARRSARLTVEGNLVPLDEQDRSLWRQDMISEGTALITGALQSAPVGPFQLQAAIAAVHAEATTAAETDWQQIVALYTLLESINPGPVVALNRAAAVGMAEGPAAGLHLLDALDAADLSAHRHRLVAVRGFLLEQLGDLNAARDALQEAATLTRNEAERRYLTAKVSSLSERLNQCAKPAATQCCLD